MTTINKLSAIDTLAAGDQFVVYRTVTPDEHLAQLLNSLSTLRTQPAMRQSRLLAV
jgi:hypothetical protein